MVGGLVDKICDPFPRKNESRMEAIGLIYPACREIDQERKRVTNNRLAAGINLRMPCMIL